MTKIFLGEFSASQIFYNFSRDPNADMRHCYLGYGIGRLIGFPFVIGLGKPPALLSKPFLLNTSFIENNHKSYMEYSVFTNDQLISCRATNSDEIRRS